jgi:hypothetical protein
LTTVPVIMRAWAEARKAAAFAVSDTLAGNDLNRLLFRYYTIRCKIASQFFSAKTVPRRLDRGSDSIRENIRMRVATLMLRILFDIQQQSRPDFPAPHAHDKKFNWRYVAPILFRASPSASASKYFWLHSRRLPRASPSSTEVPLG